MSSGEIDQDQFKWGDWEKEPGKAAPLPWFWLWALYIAVSLIALAYDAGHFLLTGCPDSCSLGLSMLWGVPVALFGMALAVVKGFRIDRIKANLSGISLTYSFTPKPLDDYKTVVTDLSWGEVLEMNADVVASDGGALYGVQIKLGTNRIDGAHSLYFDVPDEDSMIQTIERLERYRAGALAHGLTCSPAALTNSPTSHAATAVSVSPAAIRSAT